MPLDVEDVGEVRLDRNLDRQAHCAPAVVDDVEILMDAAAEAPVEADRDRMRLDGAGLVDGDTVGELESRGEELDGRGVQENRRSPIDPQPVTGDKSCVPGEEALVAVRLDPAIWLADDHAVIAVDRDGGRPNLDGKGHSSCLIGCRSTSASRVTRQSSSPPGPRVNHWDRRQGIAVVTVLTDEVLTHRRVRFPESGR